MAALAESCEQLPTGSDKDGREIPLGWDQHLGHWSFPWSASKPPPFLGFVSLLGSKVHNGAQGERGE